MASVESSVADCSGNLVQRPPSITLECGDGKDTLIDLTWTSWTTAHSEGSGQEEVTECIPDCADGTPHRTPVQVVLTDPQAVPGESATKFQYAVISGAAGSRTERLS
ncbi:hypothetical protein [Actinomycetospora sp.]|uniref:hypothetical protein n=1 Tax=Actinomycetospora sp. TaxID=1872135 RepID=UPI002F3F7D2C